MKRTPLTRKKRMARKAKKPTDRELHDEDRKRYREQVGRCELCGTTARHLTVHHIMQKARGTYEFLENYITVCDTKGGSPQFCHWSAHQGIAGRKKCIAVKVRKGEWFTREKQWELFHKYYTTEDGEVIDA